MSSKESPMTPYEIRTQRNHFWVGGREGQNRLKSLRIGVAGLGGMGSNIAEIFARLGVGYLRITDPDIIERSNLNRQVIDFENTIGLKKAEVSAAEIRNISKDIQVDYSTDGIQEHNVDTFTEGLDVIINEIDVYHIDKQLLLVESALKKNIPVYTTLVVGLGVHLYKFDPKCDYSPEQFYGYILKNPTIDALVNRLGHPLPHYLSGANLRDFVTQVQQDGVPIFGASTYLGQSLLSIRVLNDLGLLSVSSSKTPCLPHFLVLDPITLEFTTASVSNEEHTIDL